MALPKKIRLELNEAVLEVESVDLDCFDSEILKAKIRKAIEFLDSKGVGAESEYRKRLDRVNQEAGGTEVKKKNTLKIYSGQLEDLPIKVCVDMDSYSLKKHLSNTRNDFVSFRWKFGFGGRLENLDLTTRFGSEPILLVENNSLETQRLRSYKLPKKAEQFTADIKINPKNMFYQNLIRRGYSHMQEILKNIELGKFKGSHFSHAEISLGEIISNSNAMEMINRTVGIVPYVNLDSSEKLVISYKPYKKE